MQHNRLCERVNGSQQSFDADTAMCARPIFFCDVSNSPKKRYAMQFKGRFSKRTLGSSLEFHRPPQKNGMWERGCRVRGAWRKKSGAELRKKKCPGCLLANGDASSSSERIFWGRSKSLCCDSSKYDFLIWHRTRVVCSVLPP